MEAPIKIRHDQDSISFGGNMTESKFIYTYAKEKQTKERWEVKAKCEKCKLVSHFKKQSGITIKDRRCLACEGEVKATSHLLKGFEHIYSKDLTVIV